MAKKYIDAEKLERHFENCICEAYNTNGVTEDFEIALKATKNQPAADVQEVVRCRDCKHLFLAPRGNPHLCMRSYFSQPVTFEDYCSYGERKDGEENENV